MNNLLNKTSFKVFLLLLKYLPIIIGICYMINTFLYYIGIDIMLISCISGISIIPLVFILVASFVFHFCLYHRIFLYYVALSDVINWIDYLFNIPISIHDFLAINIILAGITIAIAIISYVKDNKKLITSNNR